MEDSVRALLLKAVSRIPEWLRHDLAAKDSPVRLRAEETLAAMLADVVAKRPSGT